MNMGFPSGTSGQGSAYNAGDTQNAGSIPELERSPGGRHGNTLHYSCLENPMEKGAWPATVHRVTKSWTRLRVLQDRRHLL